MLYNWSQPSTKLSRNAHRRHDEQKPCKCSYLSKNTLTQVKRRLFNGKVYLHFLVSCSKVISSYKTKRSIFFVKLP